MNNYYTVLTAITCSVLIIISLLVRENDRIKKADKNRFYLTYLFIAAAAVCEYAAIALNGAPSSYKMIHSLVKSLDYALTPVAGLYFVRQLAEKDKLQRYAVWGITANGILAFLSNFTHWYFTIDETNVYHHGSLYFIYVVVYVFILAFAMIEFLIYTRKFAHRNCASIIGIWLFMAVFISLQQFISSDIRVIYLILSVSCVMVFAHYCQYCLQESTAMIAHQQNLLEIDALTNLYNRYSYIHTLEDYEKQDSAPADLIAISIDINGLKKVNDSLGHQAGDELICGAGQVIRDTFAPYGKCFRTGGDEFIVILDMLKSDNPHSRCKELIAALQTATASWKGELVPSLGLSCGFAAASDFPDLSVEKLVSIADSYMYENKESYYCACGDHR